MLRHAVLAFCALIAVAMHARVTSPVSATLTVTPATVLRGLPSAFLITLTNASNRPQPIFYASMTATTADSVFQIAGVDGRTELNLPSDQLEKCAYGYRCLIVPPLGRRELYIDFDASLGGNEFFCDPRLSTPGTYKLQITLQSLIDGAAVAITTNAATLTVEQPSGVDAEAWNWLKRSARGAGWNAFDWTLSVDAGELHKRFPASQYAIWSAALTHEPLVSIHRALARYPQGALRDMLLWAKGSLLAQSSRDTIDCQRDLEYTLALSGAARAVFTTLRKTAVSSFARRRANDAIHHLYTKKTAEATLRFLSAHDPPSPESVIPRVVCVESTTGKAFKARFGYINPNKNRKAISVGDRNQFTPAPRDQNQPRVFLPGDQGYVVTVSSPGGNLIWHLDHNTAVATADFPTPCARD